MMYRICNVAQCFAGLSAIRMASHVEVLSALLQAEKLLVKIETLREHLWQVAVVWPNLLGEKRKPSGDLALLSFVIKKH